MKKLILFFLGLLICAGCFAKEPDWTLYQKLLDKYVTEKSYEGGTISWVHYSKMKNDPLFAQVVKIVETYPTDRLSNKKEEISFYINAYNILAMKIILEKWPVKSIKDVGSFFFPVWHKKAGIIDQKKVTLHHLENNVLRKMDEPRIHFGVVCASIGCPSLRKEPYIAAKLDNQLKQQAIAFLNDPYKGIQRDGDTLHISKIFKWFKEDFEPYGGVAQFISQYVPIKKGQMVIADIDYDWRLNGE